MKIVSEFIVWDSKNKNIVRVLLLENGDYIQVMPMAGRFEKIGPIEFEAMKKSYITITT